MIRKKQSPIGLKILGIFGIFATIFSSLLLIYMNIKYKRPIIIYNIPYIGYILLVFISSIGIILLKAWARILFITILSIKIIESITKIIGYRIKDIYPQMQIIHFFEQFINITIFLLIIYYLSRKSIKNYFEK